MGFRFSIGFSGRVQNMASNWNKQAELVEWGSDESLKPLQSLQENASQFFERIQSRYGSAMKCRKGCSACCHVDLSLFESEAVRIVQWAIALPDDERKALQERILEQPAETLGHDASGKIRPTCAALRNNECVIYNARPVICRTQGAPLQWKVSDANSDEKLYRDHCPLNFADETTLPPLSECLDLGKLTALQSIAHIHWLQAKRNKSGAAPWPITQEGRVLLSDVVKVLVELL